MVPIAFNNAKVADHHTAGHQSSAQEGTFQSIHSDIKSRLFHANGAHGLLVGLDDGCLLLIQEADAFEKPHVQGIFLREESPALVSFGKLDGGAKQR